MLGPPYLTETWAATYFQVTAAVLIFGVGLPALFIQALVPEDIRDVVSHHHRGLRWSQFFVVIFGLCALLFLWLAHPNSTTGPWPENPAPLPSAPFTGSPEHQWVDWVAAGIMSFVIIAMAVLFYLQRFYSRERLLKDLERKCTNRIARHGTLDESILRDIQSLGEHSKSETDRRKALRVLNKLAGRAQKHHGYTGNTLDPVFSAMKITLHGGNSDTFIKTARNLRRILVRFQRSSHNSSPDKLAALKALQHVGELALELESEMAALTVLDIVTLVGQDANGVSREAGRILFEWGVKAMKLQRYLFVVAVLSRLEAMADREASARANYLGFIAHFAEAGCSAQLRAQASLASMDFQPSLPMCLQAAKEHHAALAHFDTSNKLEAMFMNPITEACTVTEKNDERSQN